MDVKGRHRQSHILNGLLLIWIWAFSLLKWPDLPEEIPVHFTLSGEPDRWAVTTWGQWYAMPLVALGMTALLYGIALLARRYPRYMNLPSKKAFLELTPEEQQPILDSVSDLLYRITALINVQWLLVQIGTYQVAVGSADTLPWYVRWAMLVVIPLAMVLTVVTILRVRSLANRPAVSPGGDGNGERGIR